MQKTIVNSRVFLRFASFFPDWFSHQLQLKGPQGLLGSIILAFSVVLVLMLNSGIGKPIWIDEFLHFCLGGYDSAISAYSALRPTLVEVNHGQTGVYMMLDYGLLKLFGASTLALRLPSLLSSFWLLLAAILLMRNRGFGWLWQFFTVVALFFQNYLMEYTAEARPYMPLAAATVGILTYYLAPDNSRKKSGIICLGWGSVALGCLMHPYFSIYWSTVFTVAHVDMLCLKSVKPSLRGIFRHVNPSLLIFGLVVYCSIAAMTWLRGGPEFEFDPFRWVSKEDFLEVLLYQYHLEFFGTRWVKSIVLYVFFILPFLIIFLPTRFRVEIRSLVGPILLFFAAFTLSIIVSYLSFSRNYWIVPRQWVASLALIPIATVWCGAEITRLAKSRNVVFGIVFTMIVGLKLTILVPWQIEYKWKQMWSGLKYIEAQKQVYKPLNVDRIKELSPQDYVDMANQNVRQGGDVWPIFRYYYDNMD